MMKTISALFVFLLTAFLPAQNYINTFTPVWEDLPWGSGGLTPSGVVWSLDGMYDFDNDGLGEFLLSSSWSGSFGNDAMLYESTGDNSFQIIWYYWFYQLDLTNGNYSSATSGDLDADGNPELIILNDCLAGQQSLYIFEYDLSSGGFPAQPSTAWDINLPGGVEEAGSIAAANIDADPRPELIMALYSRDPAASHFIIVELAGGSTVNAPNWQVELDNTSELNYYAYTALPTDLDQDGFKEVVLMEWNYTRLLIFENTAEDSYQKTTDFFLTFESLGFSNQGAAEADLDGNGLNELYLTSTAGYFWVITNNGDVSQMNFADNAHLLYDYKSNGGLTPVQVKIGNADSPRGQPPDVPNIYLCVTDTTGVNSAVYDWEYSGVDISNPANYSVNTIYSENNGSGDIFKPSKMGMGDFDGDDKKEIVVGSFSFSLNRPHIIALESEASTAITPGEDPNFSPDQFVLYQNFPNPFNARTAIEFETFKEASLSLTVFDLLGQKIREIVNDRFPAGKYTFYWNGVNSDGKAVPSGIYLYQLKTPATTITKKMILTR